MIDCLFRAPNFPEHIACGRAVNHNATNVQCNPSCSMKQAATRAQAGVLTFVETLAAVAKSSDPTQVQDAGAISPLVALLTLPRGSDRVPLLVPFIEVAEI